MNTTQAQVRAVVDAHREQFRLPGVLSVRAGWKFTGGWPAHPPTAAVVVTVVDKHDQPPGGLLPTHVDGVDVDVRQASPRKLAALQGLVAATGADPTTGALPMFPDETSPDETVAAGPAARLAVEASKPQLAYTPPATATLSAVSGVLTVQACASPDAGWPVLQAFLGSVQQQLIIGLYDWTSKHVLDTFATQLAGKSVQLVLDHPSLNPTADQSDEATVAALSDSLGTDFTQAWALERNDPHAAAWIYPTAYHIKVAVADQSRVWLSSGNWNNSNQPDIDPVTNPADADAARFGDRDWHVVIDSPELAATFAAYLGNDLQIAQEHQQPVTAAQTAPAAAQTVPVTAPGLETPPFARFQAALSVTETMSVTPLLTPDLDSYAPHVQALIESATVSLYMQFQYIELPKDAATAPAAFTALIAAVVARQQAGVDVRIITSEYETQGYLEQLMTAGLDVGAAVKIQNNVHNKGIVVDAATVLVSSQNWSGAGTTANRDAGLIIANATLATYFQTLFLHDWDNLATTSAAED